MSQDSCWPYFKSGALLMASTFRFWPIKLKLSPAHLVHCCPSMTTLFFVEPRSIGAAFLSPDISYCSRLILVAYKLLIATRKLRLDFRFTASTIPHISSYLCDAKCAKKKRLDLPCISFWDANLVAQNSSLKKKILRKRESFDSMRGWGVKEFAHRWFTLGLA